MVVLLLFPYKQVFAPTPTVTPTPTITPSPTIERFLPAAVTPSPTVPVTPSPTNTRVPTVTPRPPDTPTPSTAIRLPTPYVRPTATLQPGLPTPTETPAPTPTLVERQYSISFTAGNSTIKRGDCTDLAWRIDGPVVVLLDDQPVSNIGRRQICPERTTDYTLKVQLEGSAQIERRILRVNVQ